MRQSTPFLWEINETTEEEWAELASTSPDRAAQQPVRRHRKAWAILAAVLGLLTLVLGVQL